MAKAKASTPKKGAKSTTPAAPYEPETTDLRRSSRKAVESAKKKETESPSKPAKVVKRASPAKKKASAAKASPSTTAKATKSSTTGAQAATTKNPATKAETAPPKPRGRPKKAVTATPAPKATRTRKGKAEAIVEAPAQLEDHEWTDSPTKKSPAKAKSKSKASAASEDGNRQARQSSIGGIRKSIEASDQGSRGRDQSQGPSRSSKAASKSPAKLPSRARSASPAKTDALKSARALSKSPTASRVMNAMAPPPPPRRARNPSVTATAGSFRVEKTRGSRSPTKSPKRRLGRARSTSPVKSDVQGRSGRRSSAPAVDGWERDFLANDVRGDELRRIERLAYMAAKAGRRFNGASSSIVGVNEDLEARNRGIRRAELEMGLIGSSDSSANGRRTGRGLSSNDELEELEMELDEDDELAGDEHPPVGRNSPSKRKASKERQSPRKQFSRAKSPASGQPVVVSDDAGPLPKGQPSAANRGKVHSVTNPEFVPGTKNRKNPFFETMPAPEVWHRRMPPFFPFGETPFMEQVVSQQITEDLAKGKEQRLQKEQEASGLIGRAVSGVSSWMNWQGSKAGSSDNRRTAPWTMPELSDSEVQKAATQVQNAAGTGVGGAGRKRAASPAKTTSPKRPRRRSRDSGEFVMSGAL